MRAGVVSAADTATAAATAAFFFSTGIFIDNKTEEEEEEGLLTALTTDSWVFFVAVVVPPTPPPQEVAEVAGCGVCCWRLPMSTSGRRGVNGVPPSLGVSAPAGRLVSVHGVLIFSINTFSLANLILEPFGVLCADSELKPPLAYALQVSH